MGNRSVSMVTRYILEKERGENGESVIVDCSGLVVARGRLKEDDWNAITNDHDESESTANIFPSSKLLESLHFEPR